MNWIKKNNYLFIIGLIAFILVSPQLYYHATIVGADWWFHWSRFYEAAMQIKHGTFNYFQSIYAFNQTGRVVNAMYGLDFAYFHGILLLLFKSWAKAEIISSFLCAFTAGISMYSLSRYSGLEKSISIITSIFLMGTTTIIFYISNQGFPGWGTAFLPLTFIPVIGMVKKTEKPINPFFFGGSVALLLGVHTFTTIMFIMAAIPFWLVGIYKSSHKLEFIKDSFLSVLIALALASTTFLGIFDVKQTELIMPFKVQDLISNSSSLSGKLMSRFDYGFIFSFIFIFVIIFTFSNFKKIHLVEKNIIIVGTFFLIISSPYFPWNSFANHFHIIQGIQFPQRFGAIASVLLILGSGLMLQNLTNNMQTTNKQIILSIFITLALINCTSGYADIRERASNWRSNDIQLNGDKLETNAKKIRDNFSSRELSKAFKTIQKPTSDYLPNYGKFDNPYSEYITQVYKNHLKTKITVTKDNQLQFSWASNKKENVQLPVFIYTNSVVFLNNKRLDKTQYKVSNIGALIVHVNAGYNSIIIGYEPSILFKIAVIIRCISIPLAIIYLVLYFIKYKKDNAQSPRHIKTN